MVLQPLFWQFCNFEKLVLLFHKITDIASTGSYGASLTHTQNIVRSRDLRPLSTEWEIILEAKTYGCWPKKCSDNSNGNLLYLTPQTDRTCITRHKEHILPLKHFLFVSKECTRHWSVSATQLIGVCCSLTKAPPVAPLRQGAFPRRPQHPQWSCRLTLFSSYSTSFALLHRDWNCLPRCRLNKYHPFSLPETLTIEAALIPSSLRPH